jgi:hypothetical protein
MGRQPRLPLSPREALAIADVHVLQRGVDVLLRLLNCRRSCSSARGTLIQQATVYRSEKVFGCVVADMDQLMMAYVAVAVVPVTKT